MVVNFKNKVGKNKLRGKYVNIMLFQIGIKKESWFESSKTKQQKNILSQMGLEVKADLMADFLLYLLYQLWVESLCILRLAITKDKS